MSLSFSTTEFTLIADAIHNVYRTDIHEDEFGMDISNFALNGPVTDLPGANINFSGITYVRDIDSIWIIQNNTGIIFEYKEQDLATEVRQITLSGLPANDTEGVYFMGFNSTVGLYEFAVAEESANNARVHIFRMTEAELISGSAETILQIQQLTLDDPSGFAPDNNSGCEGVTMDRVNAIFQAVREGEQVNTPKKVFRFARPTDQTTDRTFTDPELTVVEEFDAETADTSTLGDLSDIYYHDVTDQLVVLSHLSAVARLINRSTGATQSSLSMPGGLQFEGFFIYVRDGLKAIAITEPDDFQRWNYVAP